MRITFNDTRDPDTLVSVCMHACCSIEPIAQVDFERWSARSECAQFEMNELLIHVGWTGPWLPHFLPDMYALLDSFLATQDTARTKLMFWLMDREPDSENDEIVRRYTAVSNGSIVFRFANVTALQEGTCIGGLRAAQVLL